MASVILNGATSGSTTITPTDAVTVSLTLPSTSGTLALAGSSTSSISNGTSNVTVNSSGGTVTVATAGTTALTVDTSQKIGIGTGSPGSKLDVTTAYVDAGGTAHGTVEFNSNTSFAINKGGSISLGGAYTGTSTTQFGYIVGGKENSTDGNYAGYLGFGVRPNGNTSQECMRLDSSGNLLVNTTSNSGSWKLNVNGIGHFGAEQSENFDSETLMLSTTGTTRLVLNTTTSGSSKRTYIDNASDGSLTIATDQGSNASNPAIIFKQRGTQVATIDSNGNLLVAGTTTASLGTINKVIALRGDNSNEPYMQIAGLATTSQARFYFYNGNGLVGSITTSGSATAYNTSSDYRLKNTVAPMTGALAKVAQLKPVSYKWNVDNSDGEGFIAHELAEVCPHAVTGEKDAVDADGKPVYQGIDVSFLVATLTAAIQELSAELNALKAKVG